MTVSDVGLHGLHSGARAAGSKTVLEYGVDSVESGKAAEKE